MSNPGSFPMDTDTEIDNAKKEKPSLPLFSGEREGEGEALPMSESTMSSGEREGDGEGKAFPMSEFTMSSGDGDTFPIYKFTMPDGDGDGDGGGEMFSMSQSADIIPLNFQNEGVNASAAVEPLSPNLFRVMRIVPDKQDYSFVEKVQLPEDEILSLCNKLVPSSASAYLGKPPRVRINFNALNRLSLPAVGFYGDKKMMTHIFHKKNLVDESVLAKMEGRLFEPGFYVSLPENAATVVVFYWHEGEHFKEASRKDASCNFIRYLVELCGSVYICVEGIYPFEALAASATNTRSKAKRTRRIQVTSVKNNENDFELLPGCNVKIDEQTRHYKKSSLAPSSSTAIVNNYKSRVLFCEGYHHCCFLTTEDRAPRTSTRREKVPIKVSELGNLIKRWSLESNVDYSRLSNQHFVKLLQHCHPREYQDYLKLKESFQVKKSAMKSGQPEEFEKRFLKVLPEFCSHVLLFVGGETSDRKGKGRRTILENLKESHSCSDMDIDADRFEQLHQELSMILTEEDGACYGDERVLLFGSDTKIICSDGAEYMITLESRGQGKKTLPFIRYEQEINAKCSSQCTCSEHIDAEAKILRSIKGSRDFPLSGESVKIVLFTAAESGARGKVELEAIVEVVNKTASLSAIRSWVENMVPIELKNLERNISFTAFLLSCDEGIALKFMEEHLKTPNIQSISREIQSLYKKFQNGHTTGQSTIDQETLLSHDTLKTVCCQVYKDQEHKFLQNIKEELLSVLLCHQASKDREQKSFANIRDLGGSVLKKFNPGKKETEKEKRLKQAEDRFAQANEKLFKQAEDRFVQVNKKRFKQEEHRFVQEWKRKMSLKNKIDTLVTRYIEELAVKRQSTQRGWWSNTELEELMVTVSIEEKHQFATVWRACELTPMKKDINELNSNSGHPIVPTCGESVELVAINPEHESLFKVVVLKSGELLIFIHNLKDSCLHLYRCPKLGFNINNQTYPIHTVRRGFDLLAVDESTRSMALYEKDKSKIAIYKFDESFRKVYWTGVDINLESYKGSKIITWMHLIPGKMELLLVDDTNRVRVAEIREKPMMKAKHISLPLQQPPLKVCISVDGFFFIVFRKFQCSGDDVDGGRRRHESPGVMLEIYVLGDTMSHLKTINLDAQASRISDLEELEVKITSFGSQSQLVLYSPVDSPGFISSHVLKTALAREVVQLQQVSQNKAPELESEETETVGSCPYLGYIYHIFDKFATTPALFPDYKKCITFKVVLDPCNGGPACMKYLEALIRQLKAGKDKDFSNMKIQFQANNVENYLISVAAEEQLHVKMGLWVRKLVCLVPIQIARAENNAMVALKDGLQIPHDISYVDSVSLANSIRFGFYDAVLNSWNGKIKVISSMGKQSSGKSYLLNHLSGSLLDVAGGRCTDGVWMTIATGEDADGDGTGDSTLYVLLDFEGLGSFERSEQEDMLLSVFNAAVSNLTIFNKKDFHLDKDTESAFSRFQSGINLLKQDKKLFKGLFYIAIKDVDTSDVEDLMQEFNEKISQICSKSQDNFILKMYDGKVEIAAMAPYNRSDYYRQSLSELAETVEERIDSCYDNGSTFLRDLKLIIAQIAAKDWTSIDSKRVAVIVDILRRNLMSAVHMGCLSANANEELQMFVNFDTQEEVPDFPVVVGDLSCDIKDSGLYLTPTKESSISVTTGDVLSQIKSRLEMVLPRKGSNGELWHSLFEKFLEALAERRHDRVHQWISSNTTDFRDNDEVQRLQLEANVALGKVKQGLSVCGCKCSNCFWRCVLEKGHRDDHSCMGSHSCAENCSYCAREGESLNVCRDLAGHEGSHDCKEKNHTCRETCHLFEVSSNCNELCSMRPEHPGQHKCNSPQHMCKEKCSLPSCNNPCAVAIESDHKKHQCHERYCQINCIIDGCSRTCGVKDHFHDLDPDAEHLCGNEHACPQECEMPGICEIFTELVRQTRVFHGQRGSFEYELVSEQNGLRKRCCIPIPPFERDHQGPHVHTKNTDCVHYCDSRCQSCGYFCQLPIDHSGLHDTVHGNMRNARFISEGEDIEIQDRKYKWGERGEAEMCNMYCKKQGRGHIHLVPCPDSKCTGNLYDGSRHETVKYGPDVDIPKDEMTHETFWEYVRFVDPCTEEEREEFGRCNHYCKSEEHEAEAGGSDKSYCTEKLWHQPIKSTGHGLSSAGYITENGHHFGCDHSKNVPHHVIFVIDRSGSMGSTDISPTLAKFNNHNSRLGCVYEAILRFIQARLRTVSDDSVSVVLFDTSPTVAVEMEDMEENVVDRLLQYYPGGGTTYSEGLDGAEKILMKGARHHTVDVKKPVVIFLSDGGNNGGAHPLYYVDKMKKQEPRLILHTIMFGRDSTMQILIDMANKGGGTFEQTLDEIQLARSFENLAESLKPQVAALM